MIEINLLPDELKSKKTAAIPPQFLYAVYAVPLIAAALLLVHLCLGIIQANRSVRLAAMNAKWKSMEPQRKQLVGLKDTSSTADETIMRLLTANTMTFSRKLNLLSVDLPDGIWFNDLLFNRKEFVLKGAVYSENIDELELINGFIDTLKKDTVFIKDFNSLELGTAQRRTIGSTEIVEFVLNGSVAGTVATAEKAPAKKSSASGKKKKK
ncbi:MAG TPA: hypothetical protein P5110_08785 [Candidatus Omnitrophota bacterium]|nr:hypothetical protein [Candidatus Omnitrophota bacterium]HRZ15586.1 hypothetical protein [Candidatus Omnitrophota bacterium]